MIFNQRIFLFRWILPLSPFAGHLTIIYSISTISFAPLLSQSASAYAAVVWHAVCVARLLWCGGGAPIGRLHIGVFCVANCHDLLGNGTSGAR